MITAIIGHGRSPEGRGWAPLIDACDIVVRMWDWHWQPPCYGTKYDFGVLEVHPDIIARFDAHNCRQPSKGWLASELRWVWTARQLSRRGRHREKHTMHPVKLPLNCEVVDFRKLTANYRDVIGGVGETGKWELTRGTLSGCWAIKRSSSGDVVIMVGCDNIHAGATLPIEKAFSKEYQQDSSSPKFSDYVSGLTKAGNHDFPAERRLLQHLANEYNVKLEFAQDVWSN